MAGLRIRFETGKNGTKIFDRSNLTVLHSIFTVFCLKCNGDGIEEMRLKF